MGACGHGRSGAAVARTSGPRQVGLFEQLKICNRASTAWPELRGDWRGLKADRAGGQERGASFPAPVAELLRDGSPKPWTRRPRSGRGPAPMQIIWLTKEWAQLPPFSLHRGKNQFRTKHDGCRQRCAECGVNSDCPRACPHCVAGYGGTGRGDGRRRKLPPTSRPVLRRLRVNRRSPAAHGRGPCATESLGRIVAVKFAGRRSSEDDLIHRQEGGHGGRPAPQHRPHP